MMMERGQIDVAPLSHIRGRSFNDSIIIVDEAQNLTIHELKTILNHIYNKYQIPTNYNIFHFRLGGCEKTKVLYK